MRKQVHLLVVAMLLVVSMVFSACGTGGSSSAASPASTAPSQSTAEVFSQAEEQGSEGYSITFVLNNRDEFTSTMDDGMIARAAELGVKLSSHDAQNDTSKIIQYVESAANAGEDAVIVFPIDSETCPQIITAAGDMPIVFVNRAPSDMSIFTGQVAYVGSEETEAGIFQGEYLADVLTEKGVDVIKPIMFLGPLGADNTVKRTESVKQALIDAGLEVEVVVELACDWDLSKAMDKFQPLATTADYNCIISNNDQMALGAIQVLKSANIDPSTIPVVGINAEQDALQAVKAGEMSMTVFQDAGGQGSGALSAAVNMLEGNANIAAGTNYAADAENPNVVWIPFVPVYQSNVDNFIE